MRKLLLLSLFFFFTGLAHGDVIQLKTGEFIKGRITRETPIYIRIESHDGITMREYLKEKVEAVYRGEVEDIDLPPEAVTLEETEAENLEETGVKEQVAPIKEQVEIDMETPSLIIQGST